MDLAEDTTSMIDTLEHGLHWIESRFGQLPEDTMLLQPTSPLRSVEDIDAAVELFYETSSTSLVSVHEMGEHPYECVACSGNNMSYLVTPPSGIVRRQDYKDKFNFINGAIYLAKTRFLLDHRSFININETLFFSMPRERGVDVDTYIDLYIAEALINYAQKSH
jgi:N-acylneuraminate cytidylyltransferase/CMP-N,N'-diacetyllegionaminic acid synthase